MEIVRYKTPTKSCHLNRKTNKSNIFKVLRFAQNCQFWNIFMNCSVTITLIDTGIFLLFPIFQGASFDYHKPNIR